MQRRRKDKLTTTRISPFQCHHCRRNSFIHTDPTIVFVQKKVISDLLLRTCKHFKLCHYFHCSLWIFRTYPVPRNKKNRIVIFILNIYSSFEWREKIDLLSFGFSPSSNIITTIYALFCAHMRNNIIYAFNHVDNNLQATWAC